MFYHPCSLSSSTTTWWSTLPVSPISFTRSLFKTISKSKTTKRIMRKTAQQLSGQLLPNIAKVVTTIVDKCTIVMHFATVTFQFSLPILDMITLHSCKVRSMSAITKLHIVNGNGKGNRENYACF